MSESIPLSHPRVTVIGTLNIDHLWSVAKLPLPGQTLLARETRREFGGKGGNQAVAAVRQGARVVLIGSVGDDADGQRYRTHLADEGIDVSALRTHPGTATGSAHVYVDDAGENCIVVDSGANRLTDEALVEDSLTLRGGGADVLLAQLEVPVPAVRQALRLASKMGVRSILNASPVSAGFAWDIPIDTVIVNEHECREFFQRTPAVLAGLSEAERRAFLEQYRLQHLVVTQGRQPTLLIARESVLAVPTYAVEPRDTVGAGDTFAGVLAVRLAAKAGWRDALWQANVAAALSTLKDGAQAAMPGRHEVERIAGREGR